ncbi:uncharacterized protein LTHEOB_2466 [Neofusicoccum parvum]|uniref:Uncharacterized protein n=2 Tax=Neofusicoccum parvum TaxID=310453 RepID=R1G8F8_BOTPV|nr:hypothetical protein UCRNP2_5437 [Neofusicoccum parvum UCRNP2]GME33034.1 uncharacterized protein LTHEOB_2466 [Neofusicoccum parvum]GME39558.1 uncharacterized protein LTHEOB_2466 [Neofusicoccum parvum]
MRTALLHTSSEMMALGLNAAAFGVAAYLPARYFGPMLFPRRAARAQQRAEARAQSTLAQNNAAIAGAGAAAVGGAAAASQFGSGASHGWIGSARALLRLGTRGRGGGNF